MKKFIYVNTTIASATRVVTLSYPYQYGNRLSIKRTTVSLLSKWPRGMPFSYTLNPTLQPLQLVGPEMSNYLYYVLFLSTNFYLLFRLCFLEGRWCLASSCRCQRLMINLIYLNLMLGLGLLHLMIHTYCSSLWIVARFSIVRKSVQLSGTCNYQKCNIFFYFFFCRIKQPIRIQGLIPNWTDRYLHTLCYFS